MTEQWRDEPGEAGMMEAHFVEDATFDPREMGVEDWVTLVLFWALAGIVFLQFFTRYVLNDSLGWTEEAARFFLVGVTFLGATIAVRRSTHIQVEFFYRFIPKPVGRVLSTVVDLIRIAFFAYGTYLQYRVLVLLGYQPMSSVNVPHYWLYGVVLAGFATMTVRSAMVAWQNWRRGESNLDANCRS